MDARHKIYLSWILGIVYHGSKRKCYASCITGLKGVYHEDQTQIMSNKGI